MAEPPFLGLEGAKAEGCFRRPGPPGVFSEFGVSGRKMCCGAPKTLRSEEGFEARGTRKGNMLWCPENFAERGISRKIAHRCPKRQ